MGHYEYAIITLEENLYKQDAMEALADLFDTGVNSFGIDGRLLAEAFIVSGLAEQFERINPVYVAGKSGTELLETLLPYLSNGNESPHSQGTLMPKPRFHRSPDYWTGWVLAFFQMETGHPYRAIFQRATYDEIRAMYYPLHEADESKFVETLHQRWEKPAETRLRCQREARGISQSQLAQRSGVSLRSIQMYEQRNKSVNKAQAETLYRLSLALGCTMEDLLER
ncbi:MAG: helix-turn-helix transcriptional regulator [Eggerthellaceae bacterium]|nr:helix-turn-helix transcriptional regulator [Eggerthellaceae bacterium]